MFIWCRVWGGIEFRAQGFGGGLSAQELSLEHQPLERYKFWLSPLELTFFRVMSPT